MQLRTEATREEMRDAKLPLAYRDSCANLLIPLNRCRFETYYLPWKCEVGPHPTALAAPVGHGRTGLDGTATPGLSIVGQTLT